MSVKNPFRPSAGATPPEIIGRQGLLEEFSYGLGLGAGAPGLLTIFTGARGIGKTVMLGEAQDEARRQGWAVISETATDGFLGRIGEAMLRLLEELGDGAKTRSLTGLTIAGFSVTTQLPPERQLAWRQIGEQLLQLLKERDTGLVITIDEIHAANRAELAQLVASVRHFIQDQLPIGLVFAGLPAAVSDLLNEGVATFLRRADKYDLHSAAVADVEESYISLFAEAEIEVDESVLRQAAKETAGYPFLIQLIGYYLWRASEVGENTLTKKAAKQAIAAAFRRNERSVIESAISASSERDLDFLYAMVEDDNESSMKDIALRMEASQSMASNYRVRLLATGLIDHSGRGKVSFAIPGLREYLRNRPRN